MAATRQGHHGPSTYDGESQTDSTSKVAWYTETIKSIPEDGKRLLEEYSGITPDAVLPHVLSIRDKAFEIWSYSCIGQVRFLSYTLPSHPYYERTMELLRSGATFVDVGCCFAQMIRFLVYNDKVPAHQLYAFDLEPGFVEMGFELFRDKEKLDAHFLSGDLLADPAKEHQLSTLEGKMDVVHVAQVLHSWAWDHQLKAAKRLVSLTRPQAGSLIIGNQMGSLNPGQYPMPTGDGQNYRHDDASMARFWKQVGEETGTSWKVESGLYLPAVVKENMHQSWAKVDPGMRMIWFMVTRL